MTVSDANPEPPNPVAVTEYVVVLSGHITVEPVVPDAITEEPGGEVTSAVTTAEVAVDDESHRSVVHSPATRVVLSAWMEAVGGFGSGVTVTVVPANDWEPTGPAVSVYVVVVTGHICAEPSVIDVGGGEIDTAVPAGTLHVSDAHCPASRGFGPAEKLEMTGGGGGGVTGGSTTAGALIAKDCVFEPFPAFISTTPGPAANNLGAKD